MCEGNAKENLWLKYICSCNIFYWFVLTFDAFTALSEKVITLFLHLVIYKIYYIYLKKKQHTDLKQAGTCICGEANKDFISEF
jgi:hypothetical protein